jgi:hypothetical protein
MALFSSISPFDVYTQTFLFVSLLLILPGDLIFKHFHSSNWGDSAGSFSRIAK